ncbi:glutamine amidotransferase [Longimycelium tulufanense]|uniref:Glutamine amidotransferase n=1 Tax=Longimycelium tulufanense TaxID=907463 RepID=A0A8J3FSB1_9PSEU|nr:DJ-1/PfpI family protein [Longimycelium tulufanense]GGM33486.1 glutamine amidotransferase [Longimycelium tulufanense]
MLVVIPLFPDFTALDAVGPYEVFRLLPGTEVVLVAACPGAVRADSRKLALTADRAFDEIDSCDVLVVPGGPGSRKPPDALVRWLQKVHPTTRWTTSVCTGALILGKAGILRGGMTATTHWAAADLLRAFGVEYSTERVVFQDKHRVATGAGVTSGIDFALTLAARLADEETAQAIQLVLQYDPQPPFDAGDPGRATPAVRERALDILHHLVPAVGLTGPTSGA